MWEFLTNPTSNDTDLRTPPKISINSFRKIEKTEPKITNHGIASLKNYQPVCQFAPPENRRVGRSKVAFWAPMFSGAPCTTPPSIPSMTCRRHLATSSLLSSDHAAGVSQRFGLENPEAHLKLAAKFGWVPKNTRPTGEFHPKNPTPLRTNSEVLLVFFFFSAFGAFLVFLQPKQGNVSHLSFLATQPCQWCFPVNSRIHIYLLAGRWRNLLQHITFKLKAPKTLKASKTGGVFYPRFRESAPWNRRLANAGSVEVPFGSTPSEISTNASFARNL